MIEMHTFFRDVGAILSSSRITQSNFIQCLHSEEIIVSQDQIADLTLLVSQFIVHNKPVRENKDAV